MTNIPMTCPSADDLSAFHDGALVTPERARVEQHVASCADCARALARLQRVSGLLSALPREEASPALVREVAQQAAGKRRPAKWHLMALPLASAAAMIALSFILLRVTREETMEGVAPAMQASRMNEARRGAEMAKPSPPPSASVVELGAASAPMPIEEVRGKKEVAGEASPAEAPAAMSEDKLAAVDEARPRRPENQAASAGPAAILDAVVASPELAKSDAPKDADAEREQDSRKEQAVGRDESGFAPEPQAELAATAQRQAAAPASPAAAAPAAPAPAAKSRANEALADPVEDAKSGYAEGSVVGGVLGGVISGTLGSDVAQQPTTASTPITITAGVTAPVLIEPVEHDCPAPARVGVVGGEIVLNCIVDERGAVRVERVLKSVPLCDKAAIAAVSQWIYRPAIFQGHPQAVYLVVRVNAFTR